MPAQRHARRITRHGSHAAYAAYANTASISTMIDIQNYPKDSPEIKAAIVTMRQSIHTHNALKDSARVRVSHIRHTKGGGETSDSDRVSAELAYERFLKPRSDFDSFEYDNQHVYDRITIRRSSFTPSK
jgi:hypothetical protein